MYSCFLIFSSIDSAHGLENNDSYEEFAFEVAPP